MAVDDGAGLKPVPPPPPQSKVDVTPEKLEAIRQGMKFQPLVKMADQFMPLVLI